MDIIQLIVLGSALFFFAVVVAMTSKNKITDQYAFMWLTLSVIGVILAVALPFLNRLALSIGIAYLPSLIFLLAFLVVLFLLIYHTSLLSKQESRLKVLIQEVGYLEKELRDARNGDKHP
ncbi:DUF2304 domain-containing protein [Indiicoccus explosivorum]|uniref:DUF2304 domain-containing protein n=1 Tax=Indiicoccus explosivorum TaxID=1917864 RepID=UPI000B4302DD|nr:DUF2304 domain-containing protein [Indiicoccus explosivorum]